MEIHPEISLFIDDIDSEPSETCGRCLRWFIDTLPNCASSFCTLAKANMTTRQIYQLFIQANPENQWPTATTHDLEKHKTIVAAIEWAVRRQRQDVATHSNN